MKFQRSTLAMLFVTALAGTAQAADTAVGSEFFHQAPAGISEVTPHIGYRSFTFKAKGGTSDTTLSGLNRIGASYEYGLNEMLSLGADLSYSTLETDGTPKSKFNGLEDPTLFVKGTSAMDFGRLRYGANLGLGFQKSKNATASQDGNVATGGFSLAPYVGLDADVGPGVLGGRLSYTFRFERTTEVAGSGDTKSTGGNELGLSAFYEYMLSDMLLGGALNYRMVTDTEDESGGVKTKNNDDYAPFGLSLYTRIPVTEAAVVIPRLDYDFSAGGEKYDKYNDLALSIAARFAF